jgi:DNA-binding NarL/FixJ family response regulator
MKTAYRQNRVLIVEAGAKDGEAAKAVIATIIDPRNIEVAASTEDAAARCGDGGSFGTEADCPTCIVVCMGDDAAEGLSFLEQIRSLEHLRRAPVVILVDGRDRETIQKAYHCGANSCLSKPLAPEEFQAAIDRLGLYWLTINRN